MSKGKKNISALSLPHYYLINLNGQLTKIIGEQLNNYWYSQYRLLMTLMKSFRQMLHYYDCLKFLRYHASFSLCIFSGFKESRRGCCGTGLIEVAVLCNILSKTCANASEYVFWDSYHPTQRAYEFIVADIIDETRAALTQKPLSFEFFILQSF